MRSTSTLTTTAPLPRRSTTLVNDQQLRVIKTTGAGPYTLTVRPITWFDRLLGGVRYYLAAPKRWFRSWQEARWDRLDAQEANDG